MRYTARVRAARVRWPIIAVIVALIPLLIHVLGVDGLVTERFVPDGPKGDKVEAKITTLQFYNPLSTLGVDYTYHGVHVNDVAPISTQMYKDLQNTSTITLTIPDPSKPSQFEVGSSAVPQITTLGQFAPAFWIAAVLIILTVCGLEVQRRNEFNLLRHGWTAIGTVTGYGGRPGLMTVTFTYSTPSGPISTSSQSPPNVRNMLPNGSSAVVVYTPGFPLRAKPLPCFDGCELV